MKLFYSILLLLFLVTGNSQVNDPQKVDYNLNVALEHRTSILKVKGTITYQNRSDDELENIYFRFMANNYGNKGSVYAESLSDCNNYDLLYANKKKLGGYQSMSMLTNGKTLDINYDSNNEIGYIKLPNSLKTGDKVIIEVNYSLKIPSINNSLNVDSYFYNIAHWYPVACHYNSRLEIGNRWDTRPSTLHGEFINEFGDYDISIELSEDFVVASTGNLYSSEQEFSSTSQVDNVLPKSQTIRRAKHKLSKNKQILKYKATNVNSFTWVADPNFSVDEKTINIKGKNITYHTYYTSQQNIPTDFDNIVEEVFNEIQQNYMLIPFSEVDFVLQDRSNSKACNGIIFLNANKKKLVKERMYQALFDLLINHVVNVRNHDNLLANGFIFQLKDRYLNNKNKSRSIKQGYTYNKLSQLSLLASTNEKTNSSSAPINHHTETIKSKRLLNMIEELVTKDDYNQKLRSFFDLYIGKHPSMDDFVSLFEKEGKQKIEKILDSSVKMGRMDYGLAYNKSNQNISVIKQGDATLPINLTVYNGTNILLDTMLTGVESEQSFRIPEEHKVTEIVLDKYNISLDDTKSNNYIRPYKKKSLIDESEKPNYKSYYRKRYGIPILGYNKIDGFELGLVLESKNKKQLKKWNYLFAPFYGFKSKSVVGFHQLSYSWFKPTSMFQSITTGYEYKTFHHSNTSSDGNHKNLRYHRIGPKATFVLAKKVDKKRYHAISLNPIFIIKDSKYSGETQDRYDRIIHEFVDKTNLYPIDINTVLESHYYTNHFKEEHNYLKLSTTIKTAIHYNRNKKIKFRIFGAGFLTNSNEERSSYDEDLVHGSISLFSQGFTDYTYDGYYTDRINQSDDIPLVNRAAFGGFGVGLGSQYKVGLSNTYAFALNTKVELPINIGYGINLQLYADIGVVNQKILGSESFENESFYSTGLEIDLDGVSILFPIKSSEEIHNILVERGRYFKRISFSIDFDKFHLRRQNTKKLYLSH